jgi:uncharacterized protein
VATPLIVNVIELLRRPGSTKEVQVSVAASDVSFDDARMTDDDVQVRIHMESLTNGISVRGETTAQWQGECRRCLVPLTRAVTVELDELYQSAPDSPDAYAIENDQINLLPMVRENLLLAIPLGPLCTEDCPGFCPQCGADLRSTTCGCSRPVGDDRWAALDVLKDRLSDREG